MQKRVVKCMKADHRGNLMDMETDQCDALLKPPVKEYCNVHNPCPGDGELSSRLIVQKDSKSVNPFSSDSVKP